MGASQRAAGEGAALAAWLADKLDIQVRLPVFAGQLAGDTILIASGVSWCEVLGMKLSQWLGRVSPFVAASLLVTREKSKVRSLRQLMGSLNCLPRSEAIAGLISVRLAYSGAGAFEPCCS